MGSTEDVLRRAEKACREGLPAKALRERLLALLRAAIPYDGHVFALTDPVTMVASSPHADVPALPWERLPELIRWRYLTTVNRVDRLVDRPAASLLTATASPSESPVWRRVQRGLGIRDSATVAFADRYGVWGFLDLLRTSGPFIGGELELLTRLAPVVTTGIRAAVADTFAAPRDAPPASGPAVLLLGNDLGVQGQTDDAATALLRLLPPDEPMPPVPAAAYNVGAALLAQEVGVPLGEPWARVHLGGNHWVTARASRLGAQIAVSIEPSTATERSDLFARASGLSARESQVLDLLAIGLDSREIAGRLFLSEHTVHDHVKAALGKTGSRNRQQLLARVIGGAA